MCFISSVDISLFIKLPCQCFFLIDSFSKEF